MQATDIPLKLCK